MSPPLNSPPHTGDRLILPQGNDSDQSRLSSAPLVCLALLFAPTIVAVLFANGLADALYEPLQAQLEPVVAQINDWPGPFAAMLAGDYGVVAMLPFLFLYALPTIVVFAGLIALYANTGLLSHLANGLHSWLRPFGLEGQDLVRVVMGFGCNVPAVVSTRSCNTCSRGACVSAIAFGSACSYQLPATLAVFAAAGIVWMTPIYLLLLAISTLVFLHLTRPKGFRKALGHAPSRRAEALNRPEWKQITANIRATLVEFVRMAFPIFVGVCLLAGMLQWLGVIRVLAAFCAPLMALFRLPPEAGLTVVLGAVRKDGIAIGLLDSDWNALKVPVDSAVEVLTIVYLAGVLLPCLFTLAAVIREMKLRFALRMLSRQVAFATAFAAIIAWGGGWIANLF